MPRKKRKRNVAHRWNAPPRSDSKSLATDHEKESFHGFSEEELRSSSRNGHRLRQDLQSQSHSFMHFRSVLVDNSKNKRYSKYESSSSDSKSSKKHVNIFTDNIIIEGKRRWKPSEKIKESDARSGFGLHKKSLISKNARRESSDPPATCSVETKTNVSDSSKESSSWDHNHHQTKKSATNKSKDLEVSSFSTSVIKVFKLDEKALEYLQEPKHQIKFYTAIQRSIQTVELSPPKLVEIGPPECSYINPAGAALTEWRASNLNRSKNHKSRSINSHSLPGNIVCGICGAIRYFKSVLQAKKFGTFSCDFCRKFILNLIRILKEGGELAIKCVYNSGLCIVPPQSALSDKVRCEACWLKLCLIGYHLESGIYNKLHAILPKDVFNSPILKESTSVWNSLTPYRGEVLEIKNLPQLSQPLFQRFGDSCEIVHSKAISVSEPLRKTSTPEVKSLETPSSPSKSSISHIVNLRLPSNWYKKSSKILSGERKGEWDVHLITPDQKVLKNNAELKLYIAKTGAIIDSNVINFSLPQNTYSTDKKISTIGRCQSRTFSSDCLEVEDEIFCNDSLSGFQDYLLSSTIKIPAKRKSSFDEKDGSINFQLSPKMVRHEAPESSPENINLSPKVSAVSTYAKKTEVPENSQFFAKKSACQIRSHSEETNPSTPVFAKKSSIAIDEKLTSPSSIEVFAKKSTPSNSVISNVNVMKASPDFKNSHPQSAIQESKELNISEGKDEKGLILDEYSDEKDSLSNSLALNRSRRKGNKLPLKYRDDEINSKKDKLDIGISKKIRSSIDGDAFLTEKKDFNIAHKKVETGSVSIEESEVITSKKLKSKRCGTCAGCIAKNCKTCNRCKDMICHGGPGNLKQACVQRVCLNPSPPNEASVSKITYHNSTRRSSRGVETCNDGGQEQKEASSLMTKFSTFKDTCSTNESMDKLSLKIKPIETKGKPKLSYSALIAIALFNLPGQRGTLSMLYEYILEKFPYYKTVDKSGWQNSIRHNLSLNKCFVRTERTDRDGIGKGSFWIFDPEKVKNGTIRNFEKLLESEELFIESESLKENLDSSSHESPTGIYEEEEDTELENSQRSFRNLIEDEFEVKVPDSKNVPKKVMGSMDYWEQYNLEKVTKNGLGVLSIVKPPNEAICFLCGSAGKNSVFIHCCVCCEPFHPFCVDPGDAPNTEEEDEWVCRRCAVCQTCGQPDGKQLKCQMCRHAYHENCLQGYQKKFLKEGHPWVCSHCLRCDSCGKSEVAHYTEGVPLCSFCCLQRQKGSFCPICKGCYEDDDYDTRMMECSRCGAWVHASCENVDIEKYQVLSSLPSNIEYVCKICYENEGGDNEWMCSIKLCMKTGLLSVLDRIINYSSTIFNKESTINSTFFPSEVLNSGSTYYNDPSSVSFESTRKVQGFDDLENEEKEKKCRMQLYSLLEEFKKRLKKEDWSIGHFTLELTKIISLIQGEYFSKLKFELHNSILEHFPWFNMANTSILSDPIYMKDRHLSPPSKDHMYSSNRIETFSPQKKDINDFFCKFEKIHELKHEDDRRCCFCGSAGDCEMSGRLLLFRQDDFVHLNCALWSSEVFESINGGLQNVGLALNRALKLSCSLCDVKGASVGCCQGNCPINYHFMCGLKDGARYKADKSVYCFRHAQIRSEKEDINLSDLSVPRSVFIDCSSESRKKAKLVNLNNICFQVGSLTIENLGYLNLEVSDRPSVLIPMELKCSRLYWSVKDPLKIVKYHCRTRLIKKKVIVEPSEPAFCFNHETQDGKYLKDFLSEFDRCLSNYQMKNKKWDSGVILHPYAVSSEWKGISYRDLHYSPYTSNKQNNSMTNSKICNIQLTTKLKTKRRPSSKKLPLKIAKQCSFKSTLKENVHLNFNSLTNQKHASIKWAYQNNIPPKLEKCSPLVINNVDKLKENHVPAGVPHPESIDKFNEVKPMKTNYSFNVNDSSNDISKSKDMKNVLHLEQNNVSNILQVDGAADDIRLSCPKCRHVMSDWSAYEQHVLICKDSGVAAKRLSEGSYSEVRPPKTPKPGESNQDELSPRKDFSIEGLLSPPEQVSQHQSSPSCDDDNNPIIVDEDEDDDVVIISQTRSKPSKLTSNSRKKMRKTNSAPTLKQPQQRPQQSFQGTSGGMYIQSMSSSLFSDRSASSRPTFQCINAAPPSYQVGSVLHPYYAGTANYNPQIPNLIPQHPPPQFSYVTPAGYIFNQNSFFAPPQTPTILYNQQAAYTQNLFGYTLPPGVTHPNPVPPSHIPNQQPPMAATSSTNTKSKKKVARVHPQPVVTSESSTSTNMRVNSSMDPIKALSNMVPSRQKTSTASTKEVAHLAVAKPISNSPIDSLDAEKQGFVGAQAKFFSPAKILAPTPLKGIDSKSLTRPASAVSLNDDKFNSETSRPSSSSSVSILSEPTQNYEVYHHSLSNGSKFSYENAKENSIKIVLQRQISHPSSLQVKEVLVKETNDTEVNPKLASELLKQLKTSKKKKRNLAFVSVKEEIINEVEANAETPLSPQLWRPHESKKLENADGEYNVLYELTSEDGFKAQSLDVNELWRQVFDAVQEARFDRSLAPLPNDAIRNAGLQMLGLTHNALAFVLEQLPEAVSLEKYRFKHKKGTVTNEEPTTPEIKENKSGCARTEIYTDRSPLDMFSWLASKHRKKPDLSSSSSKFVEFETISVNRRATSLDLPMAMRFRHLAKNAKEAVGVFNSGIHGRGLYCKREIQEGEMVIEYAGEEIRAVLTDKREKYYESRGIGCYMFRVDNNTVIDATLKGNAARFINHCCDPNCYSKIVDVIGKKHIVIFALKNILPGEELTYDYKFPIEDVKLPCTCGKKKCRKYMN